MDLDEFINSVQTEFAIQNGEREEYILYSKEEYDQLFLAAVLDVVSEAGNQGLEEEEISEKVMKIIRWCEQAAVDSSIVELYLKGLLRIEVTDKMEDPKNVLRLYLREEPVDLDELVDGLDDFEGEE